MQALCRALGEIMQLSFAVPNLKVGCSWQSSGRSWNVGPSIGEAPHRTLRPRHHPRLLLMRGNLMSHIPDVQPKASHNLTTIERASE